MKTVFAPFLDAVAHQNALIMPKEIFDKYKDGRTKAAGTGPFILDSQLAGSAHVLRRNPEYFGGPVYLDKVKYTVLPDAAAQIAAFRANQVDVISSSQKSQVEDILKSNPKSQRFELPGASGVRLVINNARKPYDDVRVRTAIDKAIDRKAIIQTYLSGEGRMMGILGANCTPWDIPQAEIEAFWKPDPAEAAKLLSAAGLGNGFATEWENSNAAAANIAVLELIQAALKPLKVDVKIKSVEYADWQKHANTQDFVAFMTGVRAATDPDGIYFRNYHPKSAQRWVSLSGDEYKPLVALIDKQRTELNPAARLEASQQLTRGLMNAHLAPGLYDPKSNVLVNPRIQGYAAHGLSGNLELKHLSIRG
jgi:peptide/nickel transport system substrate-binding protein